MVTTDEVNRLRTVYGALWDAAAEASAGVVELAVELDGGGPTPRKLRSMITERLRGRPEFDVIEVRLDGIRIGVSSHRALARLEGSAGAEERPSFGAGDYASLAGESTQYRALWYVCPVTGCPHEAFRSFHDARFVLVCTRDGVPLEYRA